MMNVVNNMTITEKYKNRRRFGTKIRLRGMAKLFLLRKIMKSIIQIQRSSFLSARIRNQTAHYSQAKLSETISAPVAPRIIALPDKIDDAIKTQLSSNGICFY